MFIHFLNYFIGLIVFCIKLYQWDKSESTNSLYFFPYHNLYNTFNMYIIKTNVQSHILLENTFVQPNYHLL